MAGGADVFKIDIQKVVAASGLTDAEKVKALTKQTIECSADVTVRQLFEWEVSRLADKRMGNIRDHGIQSRKKRTL